MLYEILAAGVSLCSISQHHEQTDIILAFSFVPVTWPLCRTWFRIAKVFTGRVIILEVKQLPECCSVFRAHAVIEENVHRGINGLHTKADTHEHDQVSAVLAAHRSSGSRAMAMKVTLRGKKQTTNNVEIMTTILATFWFRLETLSA